MPNPTYEFRLADGAVVFVENLAYGKKTYPDAFIAARLSPDADGAMVREPYQGDQPGQRAASAESLAAEESVADVPAEDAPADTAAKPASKAKKGE